LFQTIQHRETAGCHQVSNRQRQPVADARKIAQPVDAFLFKNLRYRTLQAPHTVRTPAVSLDAKQIRTLFLEQLRDFIQAPGDLCI
jgi:hypothetical protein